VAYAEQAELLRVAASASPIDRGGVATIRMTLSVTLITTPNPAGHIRIEAPRGMINDGEFFTLRYLLFGQRRRSVVGCVRVLSQAATRDVVTCWIVSDTAVIDRAARLATGGVPVSALVVESGQLAVGTRIAITIENVSRSGVGFAARVGFAAGDRLELIVPYRYAETQAEVLIVRFDEDAPVTYGARYSNEQESGRLFAALLAALWNNPAQPRPAVPLAHEGTAADDALPAADIGRPARRGGLHVRRADR
jgi:hypothetical protein